MVKPENRKEWILSRMRRDGCSVDVLNRDFVDDYVEATGAPYDPMPYGADKCKQLGRDLSQMTKEGTLERVAVGLAGVGMGFPKWVWSYRLKEHV